MNKELRPICVYVVHKICKWLQTRHVTEMLIVIGTLTNNEEELHTHAAHGMHAAPMASPDEEVRVAAHEMLSCQPEHGLARDGRSEPGRF